MMHDVEVCCSMSCRLLSVSAARHRSRRESAVKASIKTEPVGCDAVTREDDCERSVSPHQCRATSLSLCPALAARTTHEPMDAEVRTWFASTFKSANMEIVTLKG